MVKNPPASSGDAGNVGSNLGKKDPLEEKAATHFSILAWKIPWTEEAGGLQPMGLQRVGQTEQLSAHIHIHTHTQYYVSRATFNYIYTFENEIFIHKLLFKCINLLKYTHS